MPRRSRITVAEVPVRIIQRGNNRGARFFADSDYELCLALLRALAAKFDCAVRAYCLMTNHVHLLLRPLKADGCALLMKHLGQRYVQHVNRTYRKRLARFRRGASAPASPSRNATCSLSIAPSRSIRSAPAWRAIPAIQVVELPDQRRRQRKPSDRTARPIRAARPRPGRAPRSLSGHVPRRIGRGRCQRDPRGNQWRIRARRGALSGADRGQLGRRVTPGQAGRPPRKDTGRASAGSNPHSGGMVVIA
jgi:REP element-mobilizing transposase RayT